MSLFFAAVAGWAVFEARDWPLATRLFPWVIGIPILFLSLIQLALFFKERAVSTTQTAMDVQMTDGLGTPEARRKTGAIIAWIFGYGMAIWLIGFNIATLFMFFAYLKFQGRESWRISIGFTAVGYLILWGVFDRLLHVPLPDSLLISLLEKFLY